MAWKAAERGSLVNRFLTVLLPVQDAQATLAETVEEVLDAAAALTDRFELLIIDDGSADATGEVAHELTRHYPQVRTIRHSRPLGHEAALQTGLAQSQGEIVLVRDKGSLTMARLPHGNRPARPNYSGPPEAACPGGVAGSGLPEGDSPIFVAFAHKNWDSPRPRRPLWVGSPRRDYAECYSFPICADPACGPLAARLG